MTCWWCSAVSRGRKPVPGGVIKVFRGLARISPSEVTIPTPILLAEPSKPMHIVGFPILSHTRRETLSCSPTHRPRGAKASLRPFLWLGAHALRKPNWRWWWWGGGQGEPGFCDRRTRAALVPWARLDHTIGTGGDSFSYFFFWGGGISVPVETKWKSYLKVQRRETEFVSSRRVINARFDPPYAQKKGVGGCSREPTGEPVHHTICKPLQRPLLSSPGRPLSRP